MLELKVKLYHLCMEYVEQRIQTIHQTIDEAQRAANSETKSSMGDKYETTRSMLQLDTEMNTKQLVEAMKLKSELQKIEKYILHIQNIVQIGSLVICNHASYFIAIGIGKLDIDKQDIYVISPTAPLSKQLFGLKVGDSLSFNKQHMIIQQIY